ncbi:PAS domain S-box-containing protein/diguanylate cyclase (GGDEF)-like protein [Blastococcus colisei]|uniref:PAS domain S-box-containing protein/diguanylate cyclase (GGDEF)-like protein n=1 Tax=Blastococcus colisei TaxID=1564162 RepID=A0A543PCJ0_9ACTN|nr:GGDEF domain-containing phosphodiesterase [Blastococcus colisei]TQN41784.1 PAS domain S-box-containing protein/diguanylate cyclase (GGDEF)-like protein [Blastococcus colisei]
MSTTTRLESRTAYLVLAAIALVMAVLRLAAPSAGMTPPLLALASGLTATVVFRHAALLPTRSARPWRALGLAGVFLAVGQAVATVTWVGPERGNWGDVPTLLAVPAVVAACLLLLPPSAGRRIGSRVLLDGAVVLVAVALLGAVILRDVMARTDGAASALITVGYPAVGALLCGVGLVALARVHDARRPAAAWLLVAVLAMTVVAVSGALGRYLGSDTAAVLTQTAWTAMLAAAIRAVDTDPGEPEEVLEPSGSLPLLGFLLSTVSSYAVGGLVLVQLIGGRSASMLEGLGLGALLTLSFVRQLLWARDGARLTGRLQRTEAYFRALVNSAEDVTAVVDAQGTVTWLSGAVRAQLGWAAQDLTGRNLTVLLHPDDRGMVDRASAVLSGARPTGLPATVRLRTQDGGWRDVEVSGAARAGVPGTALRDGLVLHLRDVTERRAGQRELERLAYTDFLTGLPNRARLMAALATARAQAASGEAACLLLLDLDGFKPVNDIAGHEAGDHLLVQVADRLRANVRDGDVVGRLGGDEFALLVRNGMEEATALAERIVADLHTVRPDVGARGYADGVVFDISGSIGVTELNPADEVATTIRRADLALRAAKAAGKNCVRTAGHTIDSAMGRRAQLAADLPTALEEEQFRVVYQPVAGVEDRRILGLEALVRWDHPVLGTVPPDEFIELAEADGLIVPLQQWVLRKATADFAGLLVDDRDLKLGVNVSVRHLQAGCLAPDVAAALADSGVPPHRLMIEVTESIMLDAEDRLQSDLATLRDMGCIISLDDFGRGYSSLAYLARLPVDVLKMDREFIGDIESDPRGAALVAAVIDLGRTLGMDVVAEGVETAGQLHALRDMECRYVQGWLLGRPMAIEDLPAFLEAFDPAILDAQPSDVDTDVHLVGQAG